MDSRIFQLMYGYFLKSGGEGSKGGKVIGHTASGKPIYDKDGHRDVPKGRQPYPESKERKPFPGEEAHKNAPTEPQKRKTFMPVDGTAHGHYDSPNLKAYKTLMKQFKRQGIDFMGHISYDPKTDKMLSLTPEATGLIRKVYDSFMQEHEAKKPKAG